MKPWQVIQKLQSDNSRTFKEQLVQAQAAIGNDEFFAGVRLALDNLITFGIKQVPESTQGGKGLDWNQFQTVVDQFVSRSVTGNAARDQIDALMAQATVEQWNGWYRRILIKDLRCGVTEKTINTAAKRAKKPQYTVPVFECQLAHDSANHQGKLTGRRQIEIKLDGVRVITVVYPGGRVEQFSRNGKALENFPHIRQQFQQAANEWHLTEPWVFDGEVMSASFQDLMRQVYRKDNVQSGDAVLYVFDCLPLRLFAMGRSDTPQHQRTTQWELFYHTVKSMVPNIRKLEHETVDLDTDQGQQRFRELNAAAIAGGYEGIMLKNVDAPYECKRSTAWLKLKPVITLDLEVVDLEEGTNKNQGRLGALICEGSESDRFIQVNVGSGFSDKQRIDFWNQKKTITGQIVEVACDAITQNQDGSYSLRFPRFERFRGFNPGEKI
jgi:DNA ligase-1